jgi:hypothetical protein
MPVSKIINGGVLMELTLAILIVFGICVGVPFIRRARAVEKAEEIVKAPAKGRNT